MVLGEWLAGFCWRLWRKANLRTNQRGAGWSSDRTAVWRTTWSLKECALMLVYAGPSMLPDLPASVYGEWAALPVRKEPQHEPSIPADCHQQQPHQWRRHPDRQRPRAARSFWANAFADWINERIQKYGFVENQDCDCFTKLWMQKVQGKRGGHNKKEFFTRHGQRVSHGRRTNGYAVRRGGISSSAVKEARTRQTVLVSVAAPYISALGNQRMTQAQKMSCCGDWLQGRGSGKWHWPMLTLAELLSQVKLRGGLQPDDRLTRFSELEGQRAINMVERSGMGETSR